ncbi:hypothetical protein QUB17_22280 [Microcoleus sp. B5-C4]
MPDARCPMPDARCPMPDARCPMPHSPPTHIRNHCQAVEERTQIPSTKTT